tara:strand:+ start:172 stop:579 length:408 start_codon:yes stop_codon:yes gene_type:complete
MLKFKKKNTQKINIIPLIDIIFLMLVFFMLATNFEINKEINFSVSNQKEISDNRNKEKIMLLYLKNNKVFFEKKNLDIKSLENNYLKQWESLGFEKIVILNDKNTSFQTLIMMLDLIKKNKIKNVYFSNENKKTQ